MGALGRAGHRHVQRHAQRLWFIRHSENAGGAVKSLRDKTLDFIMHVGDVQIGYLSTGVVKKPRVIDRVAKGFDVPKHGCPRDVFLANFAQGGRSVKPEINLNDIHGQALLDVS